MNKRRSNIELMRIFSMLMVLLVHSIFYSNGVPSVEITIQHPINTFYYVLMQSFGICCVNCFVMISGYFGITGSLKKAMNLFWICVFWKICIYICFCLLGKVEINFEAFYANIKPTSMDWFVYAYFGLLFMAPILNTWFDHASKKQVYLSTFIFLFGMSFSLVKEFPIFDFKSGYSAVSFCGLYMLGRIYRRDFEDKLSYKRKEIGLILYLTMTVLGALSFVMTTYIFKDIGLRGSDFSYAYCSPIVITQALGVLILFSNFKFENRIVNQFASSAFAVYLIHGHQLIQPFYINGSKKIFEYCGLWLSFPSFLIYVMVIYLICCAIDRLRFLCFKWIFQQRLWIPLFR